MAHDIFISYSSKDVEMAEAVCHKLESNGLKCWIAPRNIIAGKNYAEQIMYGIKSAKIIVLVFSKNSQESVFVNSEIDTAFSNDKPIISFKIDESLPEKKMEFFLKNKHWLDAYPHPEKLFDTLVRDASLLCEEEKNKGKENPFYTQFEDDTSKLEKKLKSKDETVVGVAELDEYPKDNSKSDSAKKDVKDSKVDSSKKVAKDLKADSAKKEVKDSKVDSAKKDVKDLKPDSGKKVAKDSKKTVKKDPTPKTDSAKKSKAVKSKPKDLKPQSSGSSGGGFSQYKIPIIIGIALILVVVGGIVAFSGGGAHTDTKNASAVGVDIDYVGIAGDGESYYVYGSISPELMNSSKAVIHTDFYDDSGKIIKSDDIKLKKFDGSTLDACLVGKDKVAKVVVELRDANGNVLSTAESDNIK